MSEAERQAAAAELCRHILQLARTASARLLLRDHANGFLVLDERERAALLPRAGLFSAHVEAVAAAWRAAERARPEGALAALAPAVAGAEELLLLALAAAPALDRVIARTYRNLERDGLTVGLLMDLVGDDELGRLALAHSLHAGAPLRRRGLLVTASATAVATDAVLVPASVVAALRGDPIAAPAGVDVARSALDRDAARAELDRLGVAPLSAGELRLIGGDSTRALGIAERLAASSGAALWMVSMNARPERPTAAGDWLPLVRDAFLAGALPVIDLPDVDAAIAGALASAAAMAEWPCAALGVPAAAQAAETTRPA